MIWVASCCSPLFFNKKERAFGCLALFINFINSDYSIMSITVIYSREETEHSFSFTKIKFLLTILLFITLLAACAWLIQTDYQRQLNQFKISALQDRDIRADQYLQLIKVQGDEKLQSQGRWENFQWALQT